MHNSVPAHIKGLIFDLDGTLVNTMPMHYQAWLDTMQTKNADFPEPLFYELAGVPSDKIVEILNEKFGYELDPKATAHEKELLFLERYVPQVQPIEAVVAIAQAYKGKLPMAVATGGIPVVSKALLNAINMSDFFETLVTSVDVVNGKPAPDTFLEAARRLGVEPAFCQVYEDSDAGLEGARRAGMIGVDIRTWLK